MGNAPACLTELLPAFQGFEAEALRRFLPFKVLTNGFLGQPMRGSFFRFRQFSETFPFARGQFDGHGFHLRCHTHLEKRATW